MIKLHDLNKTYFLTKDNSVNALKDINLEINEGEFVAIIGKSGSGKSTLLNVISCMDSKYTGSYTLGVPDVEVRQDLAALTAAVIANRDGGWVSALGGRLLDAEWDDFFAGLRSLYAALPYGPKETRVHEFSYERVLLTLLWSQAIQCRVEDRQANGQADVVAAHPCGVFICELKVGESADEALEQVRRKGYDAPYRATGLPIWLVGLSFDRSTRQLVDAKAEKE